MATEIREATIHDSEIISQLNTDVQKLHADAHPWRFKKPGPQTFTPDDAAAFISEPNRIAFVAYYDGEPAGYTIAEVRSRPETARTFAYQIMYVHQISVRPFARRNRVGWALLDAVKSHGEALGVSIMALDTWTFNDEALAFFRRYGLVAYNVNLWSGLD